MSGVAIAGEAHKGAKLRQMDVEAIRYRAKEFGESYRSLAEAFGVSKSTIEKIVNGTAWRCVPL